MIKQKIRSSRDYPYMYARVSAKRDKLLDSKDYNNLVKMEANQIAKRLEEGDYKNEIDNLGSRYEGVKLVELALNRNLANTMKKLVEIAPKPLNKMIETYLRRFDIIALKRVLRAKKGESEEEVKEILTPISRYSFQDLSEMMTKEYGEILEKISFPDSEVSYQEYFESDEISKVESGLDRAYAEEIRLMCEKSSSSQFKDFMKRGIEYENMITTLRLKKYGFDREDIEKHLLNGGFTNLMEDMMEANDLKHAMEILSQKREKQYPDRLEDVEHQLQTERLQNALKMLHAEPLGATSILGYIVAKHTEIKNLKMLIRAKETEIQNPETIKQNLVIP